LVREGGEEQEEEKEDKEEEEDEDLSNIESLIQALVFCKMYLSSFCVLCLKKKKKKKKEKKKKNEYLKCLRDNEALKNSNR